MKWETYEGGILVPLFEEDVAVLIVTHLESQGFDNPGEEKLRADDLDFPGQIVDVLVEVSKAQHGGFTFDVELEGGGRLVQILGVTEHQVGGDHRKADQHKVQRKHPPEVLPEFTQIEAFQDVVLAAFVPRWHGGDIGVIRRQD
jgi:hypothetical protein